MRIKTPIQNGAYVRFAYESYDGFDYFGRWKDARKDTPCDEPTYLVGLLYNPRYGGTPERIDEKPLLAKPSVTTVKEFMRRCLKILEP